MAEIKRKRAPNQKERPPPHARSQSSQSSLSNSCSDQEKEQHSQAKTTQSHKHSAAQEQQSQQLSCAMNRGEVAIASSCAPLGSFDRVMMTPAPYPLFHHTLGPHCAPTAAGGQQQPPYPAPHHLYGNHFHKSSHYSNSKAQDTRRKQQHAKQFSYYNGSAYGNSDPTNPSPIPASPGGRSRSPCIQFSTRGSCGYGARCRFSHELARPPVAPSSRYAMRLIWYFALVMFLGSWMTSQWC